MPAATPLHPRPRLTRDRWVDLNGVWGFAYDDDNIGLDERWQDDASRFARSITVPFPPESEASGIGDTGFHPVLWYRRTFEARANDGRLLLHFGAVDYRAQVWVNGDLVVVHEGGNTPFSADVTANLKIGSNKSSSSAPRIGRPMSRSRGASRTGSASRM